MSKDFECRTSHGWVLIDSLMNYHTKGGTIDQVYAYRPECHVILAKGWMILLFQDSILTKLG